MAKAGLLQAVCTMAMLTAAPVLAQTQTQPADTGPGNRVTNPVADTGTSSGTTGTGPSMMRHPMHRSAMGHSPRTMHGGTDTSQNPAVDRLNDQSYQAAQSGRDFQSGSSDMPSTMGTGSTTDTNQPGGGGKM